MRVTLLCSALAALAAAPAFAATAPFDLAGPALRVSVTHQGVTLPIGEVPQLAAGDGISVVADLPEDQSAHYLLIAAFLRGSTNPPPDKWFAQAETWTKKGRKGLSLTVPDGAEQVVLFLAPATGGDFPTLRNAVQGRPGAFVRAAQELAQASLDHARLDTYLAAVRKTAPGDPGRLARITPLLARSLQVKINPDCLTKLPDLQAACLLQNQEALVLDDGHSNAITDAVNGPGADLALQLSATPQASFGLYSPYIAAVRDVIDIFGSIRSAKYQYIPALATLDGDHMALVLNAPPSFHNPKSVLVTALPIVAPVHVPPLQIVEPAPSLCAQAAALCCRSSGAPLVFATHYAHDLVLRVRLPDGRTVDLPATPDAERGGLVIAGRRPPARGRESAARGHASWRLGIPAVRRAERRLCRRRSPANGICRTTLRMATAVTLTGGVSACVTGVTTQTGSGRAAGRLEDDRARIDRRDVGRPAPRRAARRRSRSPARRRRARTAGVAGPPRQRHRREVIAAQHPASSEPPAVPITLGNDTEIPADASFTFSLRADKGARSHRQGNDRGRRGCGRRRLRRCRPRTGCSWPTSMSRWRRSSRRRRLAPPPSAPCARAS